MSLPRGHSKVKRAGALASVTGKMAPREAHWKRLTPSAFLRLPHQLTDCCLPLAMTLTLHLSAISLPGHTVASSCSKPPLLSDTEPSKLQAPAQHSRALT